MNTIVPFPRLARRASSEFRMVSQMRGRRRAISGAESIVPSFSGRWVANVSFYILGENARLEWQAFLAQMRGGINTTLVPIYMPDRVRDGRGKRPGCRGEPSFNSFEHWSFANETYDGIVLAEDAPLRATELSMTLNNSEGIRPGHSFSIGDRLYRAASTWSDGSKALVEPPLRKAVPAGTPVETINPVCLMRLADEEGGAITSVPSGVQRAEVMFSEAF